MKVIRQTVLSEYLEVQTYITIVFPNESTSQDWCEVSRQEVDSEVLV